MSSLLQKGTDVLVGKRATLSDHLQTIGSAISTAVSPFKDVSVLVILSQQLFYGIDAATFLISSHDKLVDFIAKYKLTH